MILQDQVKELTNNMEQVQAFIESKMEEGKTGTLKELVENAKTERQFTFENVTKTLNDINEMVYGVRPFKTKWQNLNSSKY